VRRPLNADPLDIQAPWTTVKRRPCFGGIWMATVAARTANSLRYAVGARPLSFEAPRGVAIRSKSRFIGMVSQAALFEFSVRSTTGDCGRSGPSRRTSSSRPTVHSLESELTGCLTPHWSGRASRAAHCER